MPWPKIPATMPKRHGPFMPRQGLDIWNTVAASGTGGVKAMLETDDYLYVVAGRKVSAIDLFGVVTLVTTLPSDGQAFLARNRRSPTPEVCLVSDGVGYIITGTSIATITDPDLPPPISVSVLDGYFLLPTTFDRVWISGRQRHHVCADRFRQGAEGAG